EPGHPDRRDLLGERDERDAVHVGRVDPEHCEHHRVRVHEGRGDPDVAAGHLVQPVPLPLAPRADRRSCATIARMKRDVYSIAGIIALAGCSQLAPGPVADGQKVTVLVLKYDDTSGTYKLVQEDLTTLKNLRTLEGDAATMLGGAKIQVDYDALA